MRQSLVVLVLVTASAPLWLKAQVRGPIVAVFDMEDKGSGLASAVLGNLSDYLGVLLTKGGYRVVPRTEIRERLKTQKKESHKSCYDQSCQIELGREMAAEKTLATWVLKIGNSCQVTATLYDLKKGTTELAAVQQAACDEESLLQAINALSVDLCKGLDVHSASAEEAEIKAAVARREADAARQEARRKAEELEKMRREVEASKKRAQEAEAARLAAQKKVEQMEKTRADKDSKELEAARLDARRAKERAEKAEAARIKALEKTDQLAAVQKQAEQARRRAEVAEAERKQAEAARLDAEKKAEAARREAERARKYPEGRPTESYNVGVGLIFILPDVTEMNLDHHELGERTGTYTGGFGIAIDTDFMLTSYLSLGGTLFYAQGEFHDPDEPDGEDEWLTTHLLAAFASLKARINLGTVEFRPGLAGGYQYFDGSAAGKVHGLGLSVFVETAFYLSRHFALTLDLNMNFMPVASGNQGDLTFTTPLFMALLGAEYCD